MKASFIIIKSKRYGDRRCFFDHEYKEIILSHRWHLLPNKKHTVFYAAMNSTGILMHRLITGAPKGTDVDHLNHDGLDNRLKNLKVCSHKENMQNQAFRQTNTTGYSNVYYDKNGKRKKRWFFKFGNKKSSRYSSLEEVIKARDEFRERKE